jgi:hypothetical protein
MSMKFRSGLELKIAQQLKNNKIKFKYETLKLPYVSKHNYIPDFILPNGIIIEAKGRFTSQDRSKHLLVKEQNPTVDIRFVFSNSKAKLYKGSKTTYGAWCIKHNYLYADKIIPKEWFK